MNKLYRSKTDRKLGGICGGLGQFFAIDPTVIRVFYIISVFISSGAMAVAYVLLMFVIPQEGEV